MKQFEALLLLAKAATFDNRKELGDEAAQSWSEALGGVDPVDAARAIVEHYTHTREFIMPSDIRAGVRRIRGARIDAVLTGSEPLPPACLADDPARYQAWRKAFLGALGDGRPLRDAETAACVAADTPVEHRAVEAHRMPMFPRLETA